MFHAVTLVCCLLLSASPDPAGPSPGPNMDAGADDSATAPSAPAGSVLPESTGSAYLISGKVYLTPTPPRTVEPQRTRAVLTPAERLWNRKRLAFIFGASSLVGAAVGLGIGLGVSGRNYYVWKREADALIADVMAQGGLTPLDELYLQLYDRRMDGARRLMIGSSVAAVALIGVGAGLLSWAYKGGWSPRRARLNPHGGPQEVGVTLVGHF